VHPTRQRPASLRSARPHATFDELTRAAGAQRSRRQVLGLIGKTAVGAFVGVHALQFLDAPTVLAADCLVEYPAADLDNCPNKRPHPGNVRTTNGCGPQGSSFRPPQGFGDVDFVPSCDQHDICYGTCGSSRLSCDTKLGQDIADACKAHYGTASPLRLAACLSTAVVYEAAVTYGGAGAWLNGQKKDCECCHPVPKIRCGCTGKCYDDPLACVAECKASLGCFTDICAPALAGQCN